MVHRSDPTTRHKHALEECETHVLTSNCGSPLKIAFQMDQWRLSSEKWWSNIYPAEFVRHWTSLRILLLPDLSLLPHPAQAHLFLPKAYLHGSSRFFFTGVILGDTFAANYMTSFSKRQRSNNQLGSGLVSSYCMMPKKGSNNGDNVRDCRNSNLTI